MPDFHVEPKFAFASTSKRAFVFLLEFHKGVPVHAVQAAMEWPGSIKWVCGQASLSDVGFKFVVRPGVKNPLYRQPVARQNSNCTSKVILKGVSPTRDGLSWWARMLSRSQLLLINDRRSDTRSTRCTPVDIRGSQAARS